MVRNTCDGNGTGELLREVDLRVVDERVDQLVHERGNRCFEQLHALGCEEWIEQLPILAMVGRIGLQRDQGPAILQVAEPGSEVGREHFGTAKDVLDGLVRARDDADSFDAEHGRALEQRLVRRLRFRANVDCNASRSIP